MRQTIESSIRAGESTTRTAERLLTADAPLVELPQYAQELADAARIPRGPGEPNLYEEAVKRWERQIGRLGQGATHEAGEFTIKSATQQLVKDLRKAKPEQVEKIVDRWVLEKARYQARVVARHESVEAARDMAKRAAAEQPYVHGLRWTISGSHPVVDVCDVLASQDLYGLGPGGYPPGEVPSTPHPSCLCNLAQIADSDHFKRELAKARGEDEPPKAWLSGKHETGDEWLRKQSPERQRELLGPTRAALLRDGKSVMTANGGNLKPVHELLGKGKPVRQRGPVVPATPIISADRAKMQRPFPSLKRTAR